MDPGNQQSVANIPLFLWSVKSLILVPWAIITDVLLAIAHFNNGNPGWGGLSVTFLLPSLMFPFHYYHVIMFAVAKFKFLFKSSSPSKSEKEEIDNKEMRIISMDAIMVYFEDIPQFILQVYILWKTPLECFSSNNNWEADELVSIQLHSILASALSISTTVVPFYKKVSTNTTFYENLGGKKYDDEKEPKKWNFLSVEGILTFIIGTFFTVIPKLILFSWSFALFKELGWTFFVPLFMSAMHFAGLHFDYINIKFDGMMIQLGHQFFKALQIMFGYAGHTYWKFLNVFIFTCSLIPLALALHAAVNTTDQNNYFAKFPEDPFPLRTFCFTNSSINEQRDLWKDETRFFSNNCNVTYSGVLCDEQGEGQRWTIIIQLAIMITIPALIAFFVPLFTLIQFIIGFIEYYKTHK